MVCELRAGALDDGFLCLQLRASGEEQDWLSCELRGDRVAIVTARGSQEVSSQSALKMLLRELLLREAMQPELRA